MNVSVKSRAKHMKKVSDNLEDPETFCNPILWLDEAEEGMKKWAEE